MRRLLLLSLSAGLLLPGPQTLAQDEVKAILERAIKAHGGADKLEKLKAFQVKAKGRLDVLGGLEFEQESSVQTPDKIKEVVRLEVDGQKLTVTTVYNGTKGWINVNGTTMDMDEKVQAAIKDALYMMSFAGLRGLKDKEFETAALGEMKVNGRPALGVKVSKKGKKDINLYFDKETGLLAKLEYQATDPMSGQEVAEERFITEYQDSDGLKMAKKVVVQRDGKKYLEAEVTEAKGLEKIDDSEFAKP